MTIRFAAAASRHNRFIGHLFGARLRLSAANDNGVNPAHDRMLHEALRHFARHGLHAAAHARDTAIAALESGDHASYQRWHAVCRALDSRMAAGLDTRMSNAS